MKLLPSATKASVFMRKNLRQSMADSKQEVAEAVEFVKTISIEPAQEGEKKVAEVRKTQWLFYPPQNFIFKLLTHSHRKPPLYKKRRKSLNFTGLHQRSKISRLLATFCNLPSAVAFLHLLPSVRTNSNNNFSCFKAPICWVTRPVSL